MPEITASVAYELARQLRGLDGDECLVEFRRSGAQNLNIPGMRPYLYGGLASGHFETDLRPKARRLLRYIGG